MKLKNRIAILSIVCILFCGGIAFGMNVVMRNDNIQSQNANSDKIMNKEKNDEYSELIELLQKQGMDEDELQYTMEQFIEMSLLYPINDENLVTIKGLVQDGADLSKIEDIYIFLQNSNASLKYLKDMYYYGEHINFYGRYWIEDAFNYCSGQKEYELSMEEVQKYIDEGISVDDIQIANIASRQEKKNIQELLTEKQSGKVWGEILDEVYVDIDLFNLKSNNNGNEILECIRLSRISKKPVYEIYNVYIQSPQKVEDEIVVPKIIEAENTVKELNLNVSDSVEYFNQIKKEIGDVLSDSELNTLIQQKFSKNEIKKAVNVSKIDGRNIESILKEHKETNNLNIEGVDADE